MLRIERGLGDNIVYHIINQAIGDKKFFIRTKDYETFVQLLKEAKVRYEVRLYGYCLMPIENASNLLGRLSNDSLSLPRVKALSLLLYSSRMK